jgi:hypothetical protein
MRREIFVLPPEEETCASYIPKSMRGKIVLGIYKIAPTADSMNE